MSTEEYLSIHQVREIVPVGLETIRRNSRMGIFPKPVQFSPRCKKWVKSEVLAWLNDRISGKDLPVAV
jgi:predicted DNA-binding transcriptional regulator AlpA